LRLFGGLGLKSARYNIPGGIMRIAICDDEKVILDQISGEVKRILGTRKGEWVLDSFLSSVLFQEAFTRDPYDIVLLDIIMPEIDGFQLAKGIRKRKRDVIVVFMSQQKDLVYKSFDYKAYWFICKEEYIENLPYVIKKCVREYEENKSYIDIGEEVSKPVRKEEVLYIECDAHRLYIHMTQDIIKRYGSLSGMEKKLNDFGFIRIHKNYLVNLDKIQCVEKNTVKLENGERIALSKNKKGLLKERLFGKEKLE